MKRIAVMAIMQQFDPQFSLSNCIREQLYMLAEHGYKPVFITIEGFKDKEIENHPGIEVRAILPAWKLHDINFHMNKSSDYSDEEIKQILEFKQNFVKEDIFRQRAMITMKKLWEALFDIDICITHDIMFIDWNLPYNQAVRWLAEKINIKWLHLFHSGPQFPPTMEMSYPINLLWDLRMSNSRFVSLNQADKTRFAEAYKIKPQDIRTLYNVRDIRDFYNLHQETIDFINKYDILSADIIMVYPTSLQAFKQVPRIIDLAAAFKKAKYSIKIIFITSYSQDYQRKLIRLAYQRRAKSKGLGMNECIFTNRIEAFKVGTPAWFVRETYQFMNIFVHPSTSEACSLIMSEAMLSKCFIILNGDFNPFWEFGQFNVFYMQFCSCTTNTQYEKGYDHYCDISVPQIMAEYNQNKALLAYDEARKMFSRERVWNQLQLIIEERWDE